MMRSGGLVLPYRRYSMPETVMRRYRLRQGLDSSDSGRVDRGSQTSPRDSWRSFPSLATPSPRALSSALLSDCQTVSDKTVSTQDSTLSVPSTNSDGGRPRSLPEREDGTTCLKTVQKNYRDVELTVNIEAELPEIKVTETVRQKDESVQVCEDACRSIACQVDETLRSDVPDIGPNKGEPESTRTKEESSQVRKKDILQEMDPLGFHIRRMRAEVACAGANYDEYPVEKPVVPRYSAVPRTNSMLVNTSSVELFSSDSELSLTDSLEDPDDVRGGRWSRHDERPVRGEVALEAERRRLPKSRDAYAYFLSLSGEQDAIRQCPVPDWLRERLRRREEEIKKVYEDKLSRHHHCAYLRRRKKVIKRVKQRTPYSSSEKIKKNEILISDSHPKNEKTVHFVNYGANNINNHNVNPSTSDKCAVRLLNGNNMGVEPKIDNIHRNNNIQNMIHNNNGNHNGNNNGGNSSQLFIQSETANRSSSNSNLLQISEIIKIEMTDDSRTVITKEKQINLPNDTKVKDIRNETVKNELSNSTKIVSTSTDNTHVSTELVETNVLNSLREINASEAQKEIKPLEQMTENTEKVNKTADDVKSSVEEKETQEEIKTSNAKFKEATKACIQKSDNNSKISLDRKIADILINALEENTKAHQMCGKSSNEVSTGSSKTETKIESVSKIYVSKNTNKPENEPKEEVHKSASVGVQTDDVVDTKGEQNKFMDKSCITEPYLVSVRIQTSDEDNGCEELENNENISEQGNYEEEDTSNEQNEAVDSYESASNGQMVDKACNTVECASISTQTNESILKSEDILNGFKRSKNIKKKDVQFPPQVIKQIITGTGEYKTVDQTNSKSKDRARSGGKKVKVSKGTNTEEESVVENNKNVLNSNIEIMSNRGHPTPFCKNVFPSKGQQKKPQVLELNVPACSCHMCTLQKISPRAETSKSKIPQTKKAIEVPKEDKKTTVKTPGRRPLSTKFQMFEVIPEEKTSSNESAQEEGRREGRREEREEEVRMEEKGVLTEPHLVDRTVQVGSYIASVATNTEEPGGERGTQTEGGRKSSNLVIGRFRSDTKESPLLMRQYKGRASLSHLEGQEELLTLSKGWINFYLLKDNFDLSDSNDDPGSVSRRRVGGEEQQVEEYTLEIQATPEPRGLLPNLRQSGGGGGAGCGGAQLPGIASSSPSPTEARQLRRRQTRAEHHHPTRAVEVARSEQSISSITSSTVIMSESPPPQQHKLPERKSSQRRVHRSLHVNNGSSWTVTVAGSSGSGNEPPPNVEMKLTFGKQGKKQEDNALQYQVARPKRQGRMIEEFSHVMRNEKHAVQCVQDLSLQAHHAKSCLERTRGGTTKDNFSYEEDYINRLSSRRSRYSTEDGSELGPDLQVTGLAITPEKKPRVPTQSERDILRPQRYKFTR